ncbi:hypothetical protein FACS18945_2000 [Bacteroidia bacterium]|nr:hypothetical protein FACS18945_2000 [Bacteroidia bacterium]
MNAATKQFIIEHINEDVSKLALSAKRNAEVDVPFALQQIKARQHARTKLPAWYENTEIVFPAQVSVEQSSSEQTALYKATLIGKGIAGRARNDKTTLLDLTGGMGVDTAFLSRKFAKTIYVERNADLCETAKHNFSVLGLHHINVENADAVDFLKKTETVDCIFIDPARRDVRGKKVAAFADCEPNILEILPALLQKSETVLIKTSPMLDISQAVKELRNVAEIHVVAVENECKELLFLLKKGFSDKTVVVAVNFPKNKPVQRFSFTFEEEKNAVCRFAEQPETYLYEPNVALLKAGAYKILSEKFNIKKLHPNSHLYTSDVLCHCGLDPQPPFYTRHCGLDPQPPVYTRHCGLDPQPPEKGQDKKGIAGQARNDGKQLGIAGQARNDGYKKGIAGQARNDRAVTFQGRVFEVEETLRATSLPKSIKQANLAVRNFPETAENLRRKLKIVDGGEVYLFATTLSDGRKVVIKCRKL